MATKRKNLEEFIHKMKKNSKTPCRFDDAEIESLVEIFKKLCGDKTKMDRTKFRDELQTRFKITDDFLMDRIFRAFDRDNDSYLKLDEWIWGLHTFLRGDREDQIKFAFTVFDLNGDGVISREEMFHLLKNCLVKMMSEEDNEEGTKDLVETVLKKLDTDHDGRVTLQDFNTACSADPLLIACLGTCIPGQSTAMEFLHCLHENLFHKNMPKKNKQNENEKKHDKQQLKN